MGFYKAKRRTFYPDDLDAKKLEVQVNSVRFHKPEVGPFAVFYTDKGKCIGNVETRLVPGQHLVIYGAWEKDKKYGEWQFKLTGLKPDFNISPRDLLNYAVLKTKGLGPIFVERIWDRYGKDWSSASTLDVHGIGDAINKEWRQTLAQLHKETEEDNTVAFLMSHHCSLNISQKAWKHFKGKAISLISNNPYRLMELPGVGFLAVDGQIRHAFGVEDDALIRLLAALEYAFEKATQMGDCYCSLRDLINAILSLLTDFEEGYILEHLYEEGKIINFGKDKELVVLSKIFAREKLIHDYIGSD